MTAREDANMKKALIAGTAMALAAAAYAQTADDVLGVWENPENKSHTEFYKCGEGVCAKIVKVVDGQKSDDKNPDPAKRSRPIVGLVIMQGAKKTGPATWSGSLYNRADGKTYSGTVTVKSKTAVALAGCVAAIFCKTTTFTRVK
jgi:uncharacterized protein (DUF2147 family)